jgi:hypothetical protein
MRIESDIRRSAEELRRARKNSENIAHEHWPLYDAGFASFAQTFKDVLPGGKKITREAEASALFTEYIRSILRPDLHAHLNAIELGGPGGKLFEGFPKRFFEKTFGVCLADSQNPINEQLASSHEIIRGDLHRNDTYKKIETALHGGKASLIISRMYGGLDEVTRDPVIWAKVARAWYRLLSEDGLMFVQYRASEGAQWVSETEIRKDVREKLLKEWTEFLQDNYGDTLEVQLGDHEFRLRKKEGAPKELPILETFDRTPIIETRK